MTKGARKQRGNRHVVRHGTGWGGVRTPGAFESRFDAPNSGGGRASGAKASARKGAAGGGEVVIHGRNGRIRDSDTVGRRDPFPPRDTRH